MILTVYIFVCRPEQAEQDRVRDQKRTRIMAQLVQAMRWNECEEETTEEPWTGQAETLFVPFALACTVPAGLHSTCLGVNIHGWY